MIRSVAGVAAAALLAVLYCDTPALAQTSNPSGTVTLVLATAPGGIADAVARILQPVFSKGLGQSVIIENRPGAAGVLGTVSVAKSPPDGQTVLLNLEMHVINDLGTTTNPPYDAMRDFAPVSLLARLPNMIAVPSALNISNVRDFVAYAKSMDGKLNYGSPGKLTSVYLATEEFKVRTGINMLHVPYRGGPPVVQALMRNDIQFAFLSLPPFRAAIDAGTVTPLVVTGEKRLKEKPDVPTMVESGYPGFVFHSWIGAFVPGGTPPASVKRLNAAFVAALNDPNVRGQLARTGFEPIGSSPEEFAATLKREHTHWRTFIKEHNIDLN